MHISYIYTHNDKYFLLANQYQLDWQKRSISIVPHIFSLDWWIYVDKDNYVPHTVSGTEVYWSGKTSASFRGLCWLLFSHLCTWIIEIFQCVMSCQQLPDLSRLIVIKACMHHHSMHCLVYSEAPHSQEIEAHFPGSIALTHSAVQELIMVNRA